MKSARWAWIALIGTVAVMGQGKFAEAAEWKVTQLTQDSVLYKAPNAQSEPLGRYPKGSRIRVYTPGKNGWYTTYLAKPVKGVQYAWLPANVLDLQGETGGADAARSAGGPVRDPNTWVSLGATMTMASPSEMQAAIGDTAASVSMMGINGGVGRFFGQKFFATLRGGLLSMAAPIGVSGAYSATGFWGTLGVGYMFIRQSSFSLGAEAAGGVSLSTAGNTARNTTDSRSYSLSTSGIMGTPIQVGLTGKYAIMRSLGIEAQAGYLMHTLSAVPLFKLNTASTQVTPNVALGGLVAGARLYFAF